MGWARIISGGPDGRYTIEMDYGTSYRAAIVSTLQDARAKLLARYGEADAKVTLAQDAEDDAREAVAAAENAYAGAAGSGNTAAVQAALSALDQARLGQKSNEALTNNFKRARAELLAALAECERQIARYANLNLTETRPAWCADYTVDAAGYVGTLDIPGETGLTLIKPGAPMPVLSNDGWLFAREVMSPEQAFLNAAILPGWQKFKPTFRRGTIVAINRPAHRCAVTLAPARSSAQNLDVNQTTTLSNVPVTYMTCNSDAFDPGDSVVVMFDWQDWAAPRVIGFVDNPRACINYTIIFTGATIKDYPDVELDRQTVFKGKSTEPVLAPYPTQPNPFIGWSDGVMSLEYPSFMPTSSGTRRASYYYPPLAVGSLQITWLYNDVRSEEREGGLIVYFARSHWSISAAWAVYILGFPLKGPVTFAYSDASERQTPEYQDPYTYHTNPDPFPTVHGLFPSFSATFNAGFGHTFATEYAAYPEHIAANVYQPVESLPLVP